MALLYCHQHGRRNRQYHSQVSIEMNCYRQKAQECLFTGDPTAAAAAADDEDGFNSFLWGFCNNF